MEEEETGASAEQSEDVGENEETKVEEEEPEVEESKEEVNETEDKQEEPTENGDRSEEPEETNGNEPEPEGVAEPEGSEETPKDEETPPEETEPQNEPPDESGELESPSEEKTLDHFKIKFNLDDESLTEELANSIKIIHKLLHQPTLSLPLTVSLIQQIMKTEPDISAAITTFLSKFTREDEGEESIDFEKYSGNLFLETLLTEMFPHIQNISSQDEEHEHNDGPNSLKLLGYLVHLEDKQIDEKICFHVFYGREMPLTVDPEVTDSDFHDMKQIQNLLSILEGHSLLTLGKNKKKEGEEVIEVNSETDDWVHVDESIKKYVRNKQMEDQDWDKVFDLVHLLKQKLRSPPHEPHLMSVHASLKEFGWPEKSWRHSLHFASALAIWLRSHKEARVILNDIYNHLTTPDEGEEVERDLEYLNLCKMILIHLEYEQTENEGGRRESVCPEEMDHSNIFQDGDELRLIKSGDFFDWVIKQGIEYPDNQFIQHFASQLLLIPLGVTSEEKVKWINQSCRNIRYNGGQDTKSLFGLLETPLAILKIGAYILPSVKVMELTIDIVRAWVESEGILKSTWFFQESMYLMGCSPIHIWEVEHAPESLNELELVSKMFVDQGLSLLFIPMLTQLRELYSQENYLERHFLDFLETIKSVAYFESCVKKLSKSEEFFEELKQIFHTLLEAIESNKDTQNIKAVCHILVFWYALLLNPEAVAPSAHDFMKEEMENFYQKVSDKDSPIFVALDGERHWDIYFREQAETTIAILEKFITSQGEEPSGDLFELANILKGTMSRKKDRWLVTYAVVATVTGTPGGRKTTGDNSEVEIVVQDDSENQIDEPAQDQEEGEAAAEPEVEPEAELEEENKENIPVEESTQENAVEDTPEPEPEAEAEPEVEE